MFVMFANEKGIMQVLMAIILFVSVNWTRSGNAEPSTRSEFIRRNGNRLVVGENQRTIYLRGVNFMGYFMIDQDNGNWYTEGEGGHRFPSPDEDKPIVLRRDWFNEDHFARVASTGFNVIRVPLTYRIFEDNSDPGNYKKEGWDFVDKYIAWAKKHNVYLILDMHIPAGGCQPCGGGKALWRDSAVERRFRDLWKAIARRYADEPIVAGYDLLNEPHPTSADTDSEGDNRQWKALAQKVVKDIRSVDQNHLLIVEAVNWVSGIGDWSPEVLAGFQFLVDDDNVMYDIHYYFPFGYLFQNPPSPPSYPNGRKVTTIDGRKMAFNKNYLEAEVQTVMDFAETNNVPMNFGEWSASAIKKDGGLDYVSDLVELFDKYNTHWNFWSFVNFYRSGQMKNLKEERIKIFEDYFSSSSSDPNPLSPPKNVRVTVP